MTHFPSKTLLVMLTQSAFGHCHQLLMRADSLTLRRRERVEGRERERERKGLTCRLSDSDSSTHLPASLLLPVLVN